MLITLNSPSAVRETSGSIGGSGVLFGGSFEIGALLGEGDVLGPLLGFGGALGPFFAGREVITAVPPSFSSSDAAPIVSSKPILTTPLMIL